MSKVYFTKNLDASATLFDVSGLARLIQPNASVALKIHFGEPGNTAYLKPDQVRPICEKIKSLGGKPFYTDCNTLYKGPRKTTAEHKKVAQDHGYTEETAGAVAVIPAEDDSTTVDVNLKHFKKVYLGAPALKADVLIALTHFKGHDVTGFGGCLKNLGMGCATRMGKLEQHSDCDNCAAKINCKKKETIESCWVGSPALVQEKMVEYAYGVIRGLPTEASAKVGAYINFITNVSPDCDCYGYNDPPIVPDIGILVSFDPVALDQACCDLVNQTEGRIKAKDKFRALYPEVDWEIQLKYAEKIGLGKRAYKIIALQGIILQ